MGWTSLYRSPGMTDRAYFEDLMRDLLVERGQIVACATKPGAGQRVFYAAVRNNDDAPYRPGQTWALVALMRRYPGCSHNFAYKLLTDADGPAEAFAPAAVLDALSDATNEYSTAWRARCRANIELGAKAKAKRGDTVVFLHEQRFTNGAKFTELEFVQRSTFADPKTGVTYSVPRWRTLPHTVRAKAAA